jgi:hypothetical protein
MKAAHPARPPRCRLYPHLVTILVSANAAEGGAEAARRPQSGHRPPPALPSATCFAPVPVVPDMSMGSLRAAVEGSRPHPRPTPQIGRRDAARAHRDATSRRGCAEARWTVLRSSELAGAPRWRIQASAGAAERVRVACATRRLGRHRRSCSGARREALRGDDAISAPRPCGGSGVRLLLLVARQSTRAEDAAAPGPRRARWAPARRACTCARATPHQEGAKGAESRQRAETYRSLPAARATAICLVEFARTLLRRIPMPAGHVRPVERPRGLLPPAVRHRLSTHGKACGQRRARGTPTAYEAALFTICASIASDALAALTPGHGAQMSAWPCCCLHAEVLCCERCVRRE